MCILAVAIGYNAKLATKEKKGYMMICGNCEGSEGSEGSGGLIIGVRGQNAGRGNMRTGVYCGREELSRAHNLMYLFCCYIKVMECEQAYIDRT